MQQSDFWLVFRFALLSGLLLPLPFFRRNQPDLPGMHAIPCVLATLLDPGGNYASWHNGCTLLPAVAVKTSASTCTGIEAESLYTFVLRLAHSNCLRLNLASRLWLQGCVPAACQALPGPVSHRTILHAPNWRTTTPAPHRTVRALLRHTALQTVVGVHMSTQIRGGVTYSLQIRPNFSHVSLLF